jgi:photosystem II stability/assembly factor-like uncharacterized protein
LSIKLSQPTKDVHPKKLKDLFAAMLLGCAMMLLLVPNFARADWKLIRSFAKPFDCGYFFDTQNGLIGSGSGVNSPDLTCDPIQIMLTKDGGATWIAGNIPPGLQGCVTSISMRSQLVGYASIFYCKTSAQYSLLKTTDGGLNWFDISQNFLGKATCVYATSKTIISTEWYDLGGTSTDDGKTWSSVFGIPSSAESNGLDFSDDLTGVATMLQRGNSNTFYYTSNGGITWLASSIEAESWSVYGKKCSQTFFTANEGNESAPEQQIHWSTDGGKTWSVRYTFPDPTMHLTGTVNGASSTLYIQTDITSKRGFYRSDDLGLSWKNIAGPSDSRDTRFIVTGAAGEVVYAFDNTGGIWKTTDGGDGTLISGPSQSKILSLQKDSIQILSKDCKAGSAAFLLSNPTCNPVTIDSLTFTNDANGEFGFVLPNIPEIIAAGGSDSITAIFNPNSTTKHTAKLHVYAHGGGTTFDTVIQLSAINLSAIDPYFGVPQQAHVGDTIRVPIYLRATSDPFSFSQFDFHLHYDQDILTPVAVITLGTLSTLSTSATMTPPDIRGTAISIKLPTPIANPGVNFTQPLVMVSFRVTLSKSTYTDILIDSLALDAAKPLTICSTPQTGFTTLLRCGDTTIKEWMRGVTLGELLSVQPNPVTQGNVVVGFHTNEDARVQLDLMNLEGNVVRVLVDGSIPNGTHSLEFSMSGLPTGTYFLRLTSNGRVLSTKKIMKTQ